MRTNEFRRVGYWSGPESRFRFYGTEQVMEQSVTSTVVTVKTEGEDYHKGNTLDISDELKPGEHSDVPRTCRTSTPVS